MIDCIDTQNCSLGRMLSLYMYYRGWCNACTQEGHLQYLCNIHPYSCPSSCSQIIFLEGYKRCMLLQPLGMSYKMHHNFHKDVYWKTHIYRLDTYWCSLFHSYSQTDKSSKHFSSCRLHKESYNWHRPHFSRRCRWDRSPHNCYWWTSSSSWPHLCLYTRSTPYYWSKSSTAAYSLHST